MPACGARPAGDRLAGGARRRADGHLPGEVHLRCDRVPEGAGQGFRRRVRRAGDALRSDDSPQGAGAGAGAAGGWRLRAQDEQGERCSRSVIIAAGVGAFEPKRLAAPGVQELEGNGVHYFAKRVDDFRDKNVVIVGGGDSAVDWAVTLEPVAKRVKVIHRSKFRAHEATVEELERSSVELHYPGCEGHRSSDGTGRSHRVADVQERRGRADRPRGRRADLSRSGSWRIRGR